MKKTILAITIICAMLFTVASVSFAANGTINACITKKTGQLQIVSSLTQCKSSEGQLSWNIAGPVGPEGPVGPQGPAGVNVAAGQQCAQGAVVTGFDQEGNIICATVTAYAIGDLGPAGGIVFYVYDRGLHGLEAAPADQSSDAAWGCYGTEIAGADGTAVGTGAQNTLDIVAGCFEAGIAARLADEYTLNGHDDWFLPSKGELNLLYLQKAVVGGFAEAASYWSSTEYFSSLAWSQYFYDGYQGLYYKFIQLRVRAVRAF